MQGTGEISAALTNEGVIIAEESLDSVNFVGLELNNLSKIHNGLMIANPNAVLSVQVDVSGAGQWIANGGTIELTPGVNLTTTGSVFLQNGGTLRVRNAQIDPNKILTDGTGIIDIQSTVSVTDSFEFEMTDENSWSWGTDSDLEMLGGVGVAIGDWASWGRLEVAGTNLGNNLAGFADNFEIPELIIGSNAHVYLADWTDNGNRNGPSGLDEALYVDTLTFTDAQGMMNLNGLDLFFNTLNGDPGQIIDQFVPVPGDLNNDGVCNAGDIDALRNAILSVDPLFDPTPALDLNGDQIINADDFDYMIREIKLLEYGDTNLDRRIDALDLANVQINQDGTGGWGDGNFTLDNDIDQQDLAIVRDNFGFSGFLFPTPEPTGDLNGDSVFDQLDIDLMRNVILSGTSNPFFNLDGIGGDIPNEADFNYLVEVIIGTLHGDSNLDLIVNFADFVNVANNFGGIGTGWGAGNFNLDDITNFQDFVILANNFGMVATSESVPEPATLVLLPFGALMLTYCLTRQLR